MNFSKKLFEKKELSLALCALSLFPAAAFASEVSEYNLDEVVVTASRYEQSLFDSNANISVVTRDEIENKHFSTLGEAIKNVPGVNLQNMGSTGEAYQDNTLYINGSKNVVFLIDGVRVNFNGFDAEKFSNADFVDLNMVEKIEVLKGSASTLYGSDAQGGVINIVTRRGYENISNKIYYDYGSYSNKHMGFSSSGAKNGWNWTVGYQKKESNNFKDGSGREVPENVDSDTYNIKLGRKFDENNDVTVMYNKYKSDYLRIKPAAGSAYADRPLLLGKKDNSNLLLTYNHKFDENNFNTLSYVHNKKWINDSYTSATVYLDDVSSTGVTDQYTHIFDKHHTLIGGFEYTKDSIRSNSSVKNKSFHNTALFIQDTWNFSDQFDLTGGFRFDDHSIYGHQTSSSVAFGYKPTKNTNYYISYKQYFIAPTTSQLFSSGSGNPDLDCETGYTYEVGMKHYFDRNFLLDFNMYKRHSDDAIGLVKVNGVSRYTNYDEEDAKGFSVNLQKNFTNRVTAKAGYTYIYIDPQENKNPNRNGYLPRGSWNFSIGYDDHHKLAIDLDGRGVINRDGRKADKADNSTTFWIWDISANYKFTKNLRIYGKVNNIFDTFYSERVYDLDPEKWYSSPGRNYMIGLEYLF